MSCNSEVKSKDVRDAHTPTQLVEREKNGTIYVKREREQGDDWLNLREQRR